MNHSLNIFHVLARSVMPRSMYLLAGCKHDIHKILVHSNQLIGVSTGCPSLCNAFIKPRTERTTHRYVLSRPIPQGTVGDGYFFSKIIRKPIAKGSETRGLLALATPSYRREKHIAVLVADDTLDDVELSAATISSHATAVAPVLRGSQNLK